MSILSSDTETLAKKSVFSFSNISLGKQGPIVPVKTLPSSPDDLVSDADLEIHIQNVFIKATPDKVGTLVTSSGQRKERENIVQP